MSGPDTDNRGAMDRMLLERLVGNDREFREEVLVSLTELKVCMKTMKESFDSHVKDDAEKFGKVNLSIGENTGKLQYIFGGAFIAAFIIGTAIAVVRFFV